MIDYGAKTGQAANHLAAVLCQYVAESSIQEYLTRSHPDVQFTSLAEVLRIRRLRRHRLDLRGGKVDVSWCDYYHGHNDGSCYRHGGAAMQRCRRELARRRFERLEKSRRAQCGALTRRSPNGVRLVITLKTWDDEYGKPRDIDRIFSTAAKADAFRRKYEERLEACDYSVSMEPA